MSGYFVFQALQASFAGQTPLEVFVKFIIKMVNMAWH